MYVRGKKPPFDVRDLMPNQCRSSDIVEAGYDAINRMMILMGDIPFDRLFTARWGELFPELIQAIDTAQHFDLIRDADIVMESFERLQEFEEVSWRSHVHGEHADSEEEIRAIHVDLLAQGIYFPFLRVCPCTSAVVQRALSTLLAHEELSNLTYRDLFVSSLPCSELTTLRPIIRAAIRTGIVFSNPNGLCCDEGSSKCVVGLVSDNCVGPTCNALNSDMCTGGE